MYGTKHTKNISNNNHCNKHHILQLKCYNFLASQDLGGKQSDVIIILTVLMIWQVCGPPALESPRMLDKMQIYLLS